MHLNKVYISLKNRIQELQKMKNNPVRIAINGIEGTGKTTFALGLVKYLQSEDLNAIHVSIDGFHFNKEHRYKQGRDSAKGYYEDSYDEQAFVTHVLEASQSSSPKYVKATHDLESDEYLPLAYEEIDSNAVLISDGCYLFKSIYRDHWDYKLYLKTDFETALNRGAKRDAEALGGLENAIAKFKSRYHLSSKMYIDENRPEEVADSIIDNTDFHQLKIIKGI